jgi:hypothetical protein
VSHEDARAIAALALGVRLPTISLYPGFAAASHDISTSSDADRAAGVATLAGTCACRPISEGRCRKL